MENLGIDYKMIIAQIINFAILFAIFKKFMFQPFLNFINNEKKKEADKNKLLQDLNDKAAVFDKKEKEMSLEQKKAMEEVINKAKAEAAKIKEQLLVKANDDAQEIVKKSKIQIEEERQQLYKEIKLRITEISTLMVEKALQSYLNPEEQRKITERILNNLPTDIKQYEN